jgi:GntR family transcriptional regulator, transcriptional repressor for pyruvate dehydrogenase complex
VSIDVRTPAYRVLADDLRSQITSGQLRPGDRLPTEPQLCRDCGVSRSTVREALRLLASQHLIVTTRGVAGGSFVAHPSPEQISDTFATGVRLLQVNAVVDASHLLEARGIFEIAAAALAAHRRRPEHLEALRGTLFDPRTADLDTMATLHPAFHMALIACCGNPALDLVTRPLHMVVNLRELVADLGRDFWIQVDEDHRAILDAVTASDPDAAQDAARRHLEHLQRRLISDTDESAAGGSAASESASSGSAVGESGTSESTADEPTADELAAGELTAAT